MGDQTVTMTTDRGVATVTLNRPEQLNAMNVQLDRELGEALQAAADDPAIRAVLITGAGRAFSVGGDMNDPDFEAKHPVDAFGPTLGFTRPMEANDTIFIAAINGAVAGGALGIALAADLRIASDKSHFTAGFALIGINPDMGSSYYLTRAIGYARALDFFLFGSRVSAQDALTMGMVNRVVPAEDFLADATAYARAIADLPPLAVAATKRLLRQALISPATEVLWEEAETVIRLLQTSDFKEGVEAFLEKRKPVFKGC